MPGNSRGHSQTSSSQRPSGIPRPCSIPSSSTPPAIANTSVLAQRRPLYPSQQPSNSQFQHANNVDIHGGKFTTELGPRLVNNLTINVTHPENGGQHPMPIKQPVSTLHQGERTSDEVELADSNPVPGEDGDAIPRSNLTSRNPPVTKTWSQVYETHLAPNQRGYALWVPEPNKNLPLPYQRKGVEIGDIGIITPDGSFSFLFNICAPRDDPINPRSLPEEFAPIHPPIDPIDIRKLAVFKEGSYLASTSIEKSQDGVSSPGLCFRTSGSEGAILTMPDGAISQDLENLPIFREYVAANVERWYRFINGPRGREAKNGDVRLVVGYDKASSWGMAALTNVTQHSQLRFKPLDTQSPSSSGCGYTWEYSGVANVKVGPDQKEIDELRREDPDDSPTGHKYLNQCLFVRTLNVTLNDEDWENLNHGVGIGYTLNSVGKHETGMPFRSPGNRAAPSDGTQTTSPAPGGYGTQQGAGNSSAIEFTSLGINLSRLTIDVPPTATSHHPSRIINEILLKKIPTAKMVITHDEDWYPCIQEDMTTSSDPEQVLASILSVNDIREENGVVYLEPKVTREMKYFTDLEKLSIELEQKSSNLEEYLYGVDPGRSARWNEIVFLLELCHHALSASVINTDNSILSSRSLPDTQRVREIETLIGSLLIDELFLDKPDTFGLIYALRLSSQGLQPFSSNFRRDTFQELSLILGRGSNVECLNSPSEQWIYGEILDRDISWKRSKTFLAVSSRFYLLYLALGEPSDLKHTIENFRKQKLPECTLRSVNMPPTENVTKRNSEDKNASINDPHTTRPMPLYVPEDYGYSDHPRMQSGRDPQFEQKQARTSQGRLSRDDDDHPVVYKRPRTGPYQVVPLHQRAVAMSACPPASIQQSNTWTEPPWSGWIETTGDALLILEAARRGLIPRVTRRLIDSERKMITSGSVFVFDENESGIKRWTDGFFWSPSRILGNFLIYRETDKRGAGHRSGRADSDMSYVLSPDSSRPEAHSLSRPRTDSDNLSPDKQRERTLMGSLTNRVKFKPDGLFKKTFSVTIGGVMQHLISYYKVEDVTNGRLRSPSSFPELSLLDISPEYLDKTHFRNPPKVEIGVDGIPRYRGEGDDIENSPSILTVPLSSDMPLLTEGRIPEASSNRRGKRYDPYPPVPKRQRRITKSSQPDGRGTPMADPDSPEASASSATPQPIEEPLPPTAAVSAYPDLNLSAAAPPPASYPAHQFYPILGYPPPPHGGHVYAAAAAPPIPPQQTIMYLPPPGAGSPQMQAPPLSLPPQQSSSQFHSSDPSQAPAGLRQAPPPAQGFYSYYPPPIGQYPPYQWQWPPYSGYPPQLYILPQQQPPPQPPLAPAKPVDESEMGVGGGNT